MFFAIFTITLAYYTFVRMIEYKDITIFDSKSNAESNWLFSDLKDGLKLLQYQDEEIGKVALDINPKVIQYFFCLNGKINFSFNDSSYQITLKEGESFFFYNPTQNLTPVITSSKNSKVIFVFCALEKVHELFSENTDSLEFLNNENVNKKYYKKDDISSELEVVLNQLIQSNVKGNALDVFKYAKVLEVLSLYFSKQALENQESCPFLNDEESVRKIKKAKDILIQRMTDPPMISELAKEVDLNEFRLKEGFKGMYGTTLFSFLLDHKMNKGRNMLDTGRYKVQDVAYDLGYNNASHFITAFKNKFGVTPKKYLLKV